HRRAARQRLHLRADHALRPCERLGAHRRGGRLPRLPLPPPALPHGRHRGRAPLRSHVRFHARLQRHPPGPGDLPRLRLRLDARVARFPDRLHDRPLHAQRHAAGHRAAGALGPQGLAHQLAHATRSAPSNRRENPTSSRSGDAFIRSRGEPRYAASLARSPASRTAISEYSFSSFAITSPSPTFASKLTPTRPACRSPARATTGTPIHSASHVVVVPL